MNELIREAQKGFAPRQVTEVLGRAIAFILFLGALLLVLAVVGNASLNFWQNKQNEYASQIFETMLAGLNDKPPQERIEDLEHFSQSQNNVYGFFGTIPFLCRLCRRKGG